MAYPAPPTVPGTAAPAGHDAVAMWWWSVTGHWYQVRSRKAAVGERLRSVLLVLGLIGSAWALVPAQAIACRRGKPLFARYYLNIEHTACIGVATGKGGWTIVDHWCRRPGTGQARPLRHVVCAALAEAADTAAVPIHVTASSAAIKPLYQTALPGLYDNESSKPQSLNLTRKPDTTRTVTG